MVVTHYNDICRKLFNKANYANREKVKKILYENSIDWKEWLFKKKEENANYCVVCGKKLKRGQEKFCSRSCSAKHNNGLRKEATYCHAMTENYMALNKGKSARINRYKK